MSASVDELVERLAAPDANDAGLALGELVRRGGAAAPALRGALAAGDARVRALAAEGLGLIGDQASADALAAAVEDGDERVRAKAATALAHLGDPRGVDAVIRTLDDYHDLLHSELSLSAYTLARLGPPVVPRVVALLGAGDAGTRVKAAWVLRTIASGMAQRDPSWEGLGRLLGEYDPAGPEPERRRAAAEVADWVEARPDDRAAGS